LEGENDSFKLIFEIFTNFLYNHKFKDKIYIDILQPQKQQTWFYKWRLPLNPTNNQLLLCNHNINADSTTITANGHITELKNDIKFLGITFDKKLKFENMYETSGQKLSEDRNTSDL